MSTMTAPLDWRATSPVSIVTLCWPHWNDLVTLLKMLMFFALLRFPHLRQCRRPEGLAGGTRCHSTKCLSVRRLPASGLVLWNDTARALFALLRFASSALRPNGKSASELGFYVFVRSLKRKAPELVN